MQASQPGLENSAAQSVPPPVTTFPEWMAGLGAAAGVLGAAELANEPTDEGIAAADDQLESPDAAVEATSQTPALVGETPAPPEDGSVPQPVNIEDDTLAWLEGLAAQQGAKSEELITKPEDRPEQLPDWLKDFAKDQAGQESGSIPEEAPKDQEAGLAESELPPGFEGSLEEVTKDQLADQAIGTEAPTALKQALDDFSSTC